MNSELLKSILDGVPLPMVLVGRDERVKVANAGAIRLFGAGIAGRHYHIVLRQPDILDCIAETLRRNIVGQARHVVASISGEQTYRVLSSPVMLENAVASLVSFEDISDMEQAGQIRRDFVANVSHELRTPLTALLGFIETLRGAARDDPTARERFLDIMAKEAGRMNRLVSDLLSLSRVEAEERVRPSERVDIVGLVQSSVAALRPFAQSHSVGLEILGESQALEIPADPDQIVQVLHNLIENAIKYGGPGKMVSVVIRREERDMALRAAAVRIDVIDRGEGIDPLHLPRLTERFYRVDSHRSREQGGTGLGLAIVKHIINRHRGRFRIDSELGKGSRFSIILPEG